MKVPEYHNPFHWLVADDEGRLFVMTYERVANGAGYYYDVFDPDGKNIARVPIKTRPSIIKNNKLYTVDEDDEGYQCVKRYKVKWDY